MSGRSNIIYWLEQRGYKTSDELIAHMFEIAKSKRRLMSDEEVKTEVETYLQAV
jgi:isopropylmalate/homocitrate/citramalate synthase